MRWTIRRKLFLSHFLAVLLISGSVGTYFYVSAVDSLMTNLRSRLQNSAALISQAVDVNELDEIRGPADVEKPVYKHNLNWLRALKQTNTDIAYLYIMRLEEDGRVSFVVDTDATEEQALPGRIYPNQIPELMAGFSGPSVDRKITTDEWGAFISGYAPVAGGEGKYLVGIDMQAGEVHKKLEAIQISGGLSLLGSILLAIGFSRFLSAKYLPSIQELAARCRAIAGGRLNERVEIRTGDELDDLIQSFNAMTAQLAESQLRRDRAEEGLTQAKDQLETRVAERTQELVDLNQQLVFEIGERQKAEAALALLAESDSLTGLLNRRAMSERLKQQMARGHREGTSFVILLADLDTFKRINDTYGHGTGDLVLVEVAERLRASVRKQDPISRWGGEEFMILLPDTGLAGGRVVADKILNNMRNVKILAGGEEIRLTLSIGVTAYRLGQSMDDCMKAADTALYTAKREGRDRVVVAGDSVRDGEAVVNSGP